MNECVELMEWEEYGEVLRDCKLGQMDELGECPSDCPCKLTKEEQDND